MIPDLHFNQEFKNYSQLLNSYYCTCLNSLLFRLPAPTVKTC